MARATPSLSSTFNSIAMNSKADINEDKWLESVRASIVEQEDEELNKIPVCIFTVPKVLLATDPKSYIPQQVALGPFHHWRAEVYDMQRYKLAAARRLQTFMNVRFERIVETMKIREEARIRACYHKFLDMSGDALMWMMAVDMAFLLEFLVVYSMKREGRALKRVTSSMSHLVDVTGKKLSHMAILRDLVMVENQIPLFLIKTMIEHQQHRESDVKSPAEKLKSMLMGLYQELTPFHEQTLADVDIDDCDHLLDFLYHMTVPNNKELGISVAIEIEHEGFTEEAHDGDQEKPFAKPSDLRRFMNFILKVLTKSNAGMVRIFKKIIFGRPVALVMKVPWKIISNIPILKLLKGPIENMFQNFRGEDPGCKDDSGESKTPAIEEITIPSVTEMAKAGILFSPVNGGIFDISFDAKTCTLYLPVVSLDVNTDVYLRNLVAYEACVAAGPLVVARYTDLMNGIIDTEEDAKFLRERGIVVNRLKSDKEVADVWNGMSKSVKLTKVAKMDKVIADVNNMYEQTWRVKSSRYLKTYVFASWKILTLLAALFMLFMSTVPAFCTVYSCSRVLNHLPEFPGSERAD
ncbi:putative UPF0481 protein At3g02645 [Bidens hawaiensis]|uniref:putative UPF0481 protein At3g02645 n=1 Tax=Bidens hawaiensis TaxID=980011 RepID=UPI00404AA3B3